MYPGPVPHHNKQSERRIVDMPLSSPTLPSLSGGSSPSSIGSVDITSSPGVRSLRSLEQNGMSPVITTRPGPATEESVHGSGAATPSRASSSSWSTSVSPLQPTLPVAVVAPAEPARMYICLFHMLDCHDSFDDPTQWRTHVLSHFRTHPPPQTARCPLCPDTTFVGGERGPKSTPSTPTGSARNDKNALPQSSSSSSSSSAPSAERAWDRMLGHIASDHYERGQTLAGSRPDFELMRYLYGLRIISDAQFKAMQLAPAPSSPAYHRSQDGVRASIGSSDEPYCAPYSRRREERMRGQTRGVSVVL
ncbi:hypothetical protein N7492_005351 [Penicillium capsulatum]|uniref:Uncharacterized protein n=1 Tax=Penicillium capsulatum TaxID=69766 RepID=A0A9W9IBT8_9EURO|nr:hypothetical protein N7492_005351 [Penicillium capsulatum]KAJ6135549.1 hypothetical protein N7512_000709 [Penicillium capsulatum]